MLSIISILRPLSAGIILSRLCDDLSASGSASRCKIPRPSPSLHPCPAKSRGKKTIDMWIFPIFPEIWVAVPQTIAFPMPNKKQWTWMIMIKTWLCRSLQMYSECAPRRLPRQLPTHPLSILFANLSWWRKRHQCKVYFPWLCFYARILQKWISHVYVRKNSDTTACKWMANYCTFLHVSRLNPLTYSRSLEGCRNLTLRKSIRRLTWEWMFAKFEKNLGRMKSPKSFKWFQKTAGFHWLHILQYLQYIEDPWSILRLQRVANPPCWLSICCHCEGNAWTWALSFGPGL